jgi:hypothetical protein
MAIEQTHNQQDWQYDCQQRYQASVLFSQRMNHDQEKAIRGVNSKSSTVNRKRAVSNQPEESRQQPVVSGQPQGVKSEL